MLNRSARLSKLSKKAVLAVVVLMALLNLAVVPYFTNKAQAANLTSAKLTIGDSRTSVQTSHAFAFTTGTTGTIDHIDFKYCTEGTSSGSCTAPTGLDLSTHGVASVNNIGAGSTSVASNIITYTVTSPGSVGSGTAVTITWPTITNPSSVNTSFFVRITTYSSSDNSVSIDGPTVVGAATLDTNSLAASATVDSTFAFTVTGVNTGTTITGGTINLATNITTAATTIPFGTITAGSGGKKTAAHLLTVTTNANNGYTVTVKASDPPLTDTSTGGTKNMDKFTGSNAAPSAWSSPGGTTPSVNTAFLGYSTNDTTLGTGTAGRFTDIADAEWAGSDITTAKEVAYNANAISADSTYVLWRLETNTAQPNGSYTGTVTLVATPTY